MLPLPRERIDAVGFVYWPTEAKLIAPWPCGSIGVIGTEAKPLQFLEGGIPPIGLLHANPEKLRADLLKAYRRTPERRRSTRNRFHQGDSVEGDQVRCASVVLDHKVVLANPDNLTRSPCAAAICKLV
jgi:hypothetical protein